MDKNKIFSHHGGAQQNRIDSIRVAYTRKFRVMEHKLMAKSSADQNTHRRKLTWVCGFRRKKWNGRVENSTWDRFQVNWWQLVMWTNVAGTHNQWMFEFRRRRREICTDCLPKSYAIVSFALIFHLNQHNSHAQRRAMGGRFSLVYRIDGTTLVLVPCTTHGRYATKRIE